jgi:predicted regulator of Ras-like GTPase activity (Roadblock/LC7/MglB family)
MRLPAGTVEGTFTNPQKEGLLRYLMSFRGLVEIESPSGHGFILTDSGKIAGAYFNNNNQFFRGNSALVHMPIDPTASWESPQTFNVRKYTEPEYSRAVQISLEEGLLTNGTQSITANSGLCLDIDEEPDLPDRVLPELLDETKLQKIKSLTGVIAVAAFFEGFPLQWTGDADFEHVAASAEDLMRAGSKIAKDLKIGSLDQLILETDENKFIIAPCGDLFLCVFTTAEAHLGLIRVVIKNIQSEISEL